MKGANLRIKRSPGLPWLSYAAAAVVTLAGLFAMHGLPMTVPTTMPMPTSVAVAADNPAGTAGTWGTTTKMATGDTSSPVRIGPVTTHSDSAATASEAASSMAGVHGGCDADHDGCLTTLRGHAQAVSPTAITLASAVTYPALLFSDLTRAGLLRRGSPPSRPCLIELCISRT